MRPRPPISWIKRSLFPISAAGTRALPGSSLPHPGQRWRARTASKPATITSPTSALSSRWARIAYLR